MVKKKDLQRLQVASAFREENEEESGWKNRVEKVNATRRRIVASFARAQEANRAKRRCGWSVDGRWSVREGGRIARRRDFRRSGRRKLETAARRKAVFHIPRAKESKRVKETGERGLPSSFKQDRFFSQKKKKKIRKLFLTFDRKRSFDLRIVGSKMGRICERKKKEKKEGGR